MPDLDAVLHAVGPRLRALRNRRGVTLADLAASTGISVSTLSRLESGGRRPTLELLLPLARAHWVQLDELVDAPATGDRACTSARSGVAGRRSSRSPAARAGCRPCFSNPGTEPAEVLMLFGPQGERMHVRARPAART